VIQALIFDCDGTLADTMPAHYQAWLEILRPLGIEFPEDRFYAMGGMPTDKIVVELCAGQTGGLPNGLDMDALVRDKALAFQRKISGVQPIERVVAVARAHRGKTPMAVASGGQRRMVEMTLAQIGVLDWFPVVVTAEDTRQHKPAPDVFMEAARRLGVAPAACTVYEDTDLGLEAARRAGMRWVDVRRM
jgi:beta-phosphoglucomutase-like phosphatase (HAD superfamily)